MTKFSTLYLFIIIFSLITSAADSAQEDFRNHIEKGNRYLHDSRPFLAANEYREAINKGAKTPIVHRNLAIVLYELGFTGDAVDEMKKAVTLSPGTVSFRIELGVFLTARERYEDAKQQFMTVLEKNPGYSDAYYYLGEILLRTNDHDMAWLFARMARMLGHKGNDLLNDLSAVSAAPAAEPWKQSGDNIVVRQLLVSTQEEADTIVSRIAGGELFEELAMEVDRKSNTDGGFLGDFKQSELNQQIADALKDTDVLSTPVVAKTARGYHVLQKIYPFDYSLWKRTLANVGKKDKIKTAQPEDKPPKPYIIITGSFSGEKNAKYEVDKLTRLGYPAYMARQKSKSGKLIYVVAAGKYKGYSIAKKAGLHLTENGIQYFIAH